MILNIGRREEKVENRADIRWSWLLMQRHPPIELCLKGNIIARNDLMDEKIFR